MPSGYVQSRTYPLAMAASDVGVTCWVAPYWVGHRGEVMMGGPNAVGGCWIIGVVVVGSPRCVQRHAWTHLYGEPTLLPTSNDLATLTALGPPHHDLTSMTNPIRSTPIR